MWEMMAGIFYISPGHARAWIGNAMVKG